MRSPGEVEFYQIGKMQVSCGLKKYFETVSISYWKSYGKIAFILTNIYFSIPHHRELTLLINDKLTTM